MISDNISFNLAIEMLFISGTDSLLFRYRRVPVSISQSRCFSFQVREHWQSGSTRLGFQSRNRDAFHFRDTLPSGTAIRVYCFNLAIEMLFISGQHALRITDNRVRWVSISQSRCFSYQATCHRILPLRKIGFNLAIEMLFISGKSPNATDSAWRQVSISQSRCFSFQGNASSSGSTSSRFQSRNRDAFHFRSTIYISGLTLLREFQSRNRDAFHFRSMDGCYPQSHRGVSISQSRCFSFQEETQHRCEQEADRRFNLAIEMLFISGNGDCPNEHL